MLLRSWAGLDAACPSCKLGDMTSTTTYTDTAHDDTGHLGTPDPSPRYDGATTASDIDARYKEAYAEACLAAEVDRLDQTTTTTLQEDHRRAHVRLVGGHGRRKSSTPRPTIEVVLQPAESDDGGLVITCNVCEETKPFRKFPTLSGGRPGREATCRDCKAAARAARRAGK